MEMETDEADSGAQPGSVSDSWLMMLSLVNWQPFPGQCQGIPFP